MNFKQIVRSIFRPIANPILNRMAVRIANRLSAPEAPASSAYLNQRDKCASFDLILLTVARAIAASGDHQIILPTDSARSQKKPEEIKIGFFGNIANNAYNFVKCLRRLGYDAELVIEDGFFDVFLMNRPFWEDVEVECSSYEEGLKHEYRWTQPHYVRRVMYDEKMQTRYQNRYSAIPEIQSLYKKAFGLELPTDRAILLAQHMGHWPYLLAMKRYDVIQFSGAPVLLGAFCPKPYVIFPTGSDLFMSPFEENLFGLLMRAGYSMAGHILFSETNYPEYLNRFKVTCPKSFSPLMIDTEIYRPGDGGKVKQNWISRSGGNRFALCVCRESWQWKGNNRIVQGFANFIHRVNSEKWRLVLMEWGPDVERTKALVREIGIEDMVLWEPLSSKPLLRLRQQAADIVVDQLVMDGYGTSVLESMAAAKAIIMRPVNEQSHLYLSGSPPFIGAVTSDDVHTALLRTMNNDFMRSQGNKNLKWVYQYHSYKSVANKYIDGYIASLNLQRGSSL